MSMCPEKSERESQKQKSADELHVQDKAQHIKFLVYQAPTGVVM